MTGLITLRTPTYGRCFRRWRRRGHGIPDFVDNSLAMFIDRLLAGFFVEIVNGSDEIVVGGVTDPVKEMICHNVRIANVFDKRRAISIYVGLLAPVVKVPSELLIIFVWNIVYFRSAQLSLWWWARNSEHIFELFRVAEITTDARSSWRTAGQGPLMALLQSRILAECC